jgi:hypothetical protein
MAMPHEGSREGTDARSAGDTGAPGDPCAALPHPRARRMRGPQWDTISISAAGDPGRTLALQLPGNPLDPQWDDRVLCPAIAECARIASVGGKAPHLIAWSGTLADSLFAADMRNWMRPGWDALQQRLDRWRGMLEPTGVRLALHPHARHLLSDVAGSMRILVDRAGQPFDVICAPAALLTAEMLGDGAREGTRGRIAEARDVREHLLRALSVLGPRTPLCILQDARVAADAARSVRDVDDETPALETCAPGTGALPWDALRTMTAEHLPAHVPILAE